MKRFEELGVKEQCNAALACREMLLTLMGDQAQDPKVEEIVSLLAWEMASGSSYPTPDTMVFMVRVTKKRDRN